MASPSAYTSGETEPVLSDVMRYFERPLVHAGVQRIQKIKIYPRSPLDITDLTDVEFNIPASTYQHYDLQRTKLRVQFSIGKRDANNQVGLAFSEGTLPPGTNPTSKQLGSINYSSSMEAPDADFVGLIDAFLHTMWENVTLAFNGTVVYNSNNDHAYRTYMDLRVRTDDQDMDRLEYQWLYTREQHTGPNDSPNGFIAQNEGVCKRWERIKGRNVIQLEGPVLCDLWKDMNHLLINGVAVQLKLTPAPNKFRMMVFPEDLIDRLALKIDKIYLEVPYYLLSPEALRGVDSGLNSHYATYPFVRSEFKVLPLHFGIREQRIPDIFNRQVPIDLIIAMVKRDNFTGSYQLNPFFFSRFHLETAAFYLDNVPIPAEPFEIGEPEDPRTALSGRKSTDETLMDLITSCWEVAGTSNNGINLRTFKDGNFFLCFKTDPTVPPHVPYWGVPKSGNTSLYLRFSEPLEFEAQLLMLARYPAIMKIDKNRNVTVR